MTFDPAVPLNSDSPSTFPGQNQTNMARLQTLLGADHQFNLSAAANDGYHNLIHMTQQAPSGVLAATGRLYAKSVGGLIQLFYMDDTGVEFQVTPGVVAAVNFDGTGANGVKTMRSSYNVASVTKSGAADSEKYRIAFTNAMPDTNYLVHVTGMRTSVSGECAGQIYGAAAYATSVDTTFVDVGFNRGSSKYVGDVIMGNVIVYRAT